MIEAHPKSTSKPVILSIGGVGQHPSCDDKLNTQSQGVPNVRHIQLTSCAISSNSDGSYKVDPVSDDVFAEQLKAIEDSNIDVIEMGLLVSEFQVNALAEFLQTRPVVTVYCPVFLSVSPKDANNTDLVDLIRQKLLGLCHLLLLNIEDPQSHSIIDQGSMATVEEAADFLLDLGTQTVLINEAECSDERYCTDHFIESATAFQLQSPSVKGLQHGPNADRLSFTIARLIAQGHFFNDAIVKGITERNRLYRLASATENEPSTVNPSIDDQQCDIPLLVAANSVENNNEMSFPSLSENALGLYPVVDRASWLDRLLPLGVSTIQLRVKDLQGIALKKEIAKAVKIAQQYDCRLFINDYWELAIECGAYGVHLGQEDIENADLIKILDAGLRLGLSSHCHYEVARCLAIKPSYIAIGPVFPTTTKVMPWTTHGIQGLAYWQATLNYPLVAIAGIKPANFTDVVATGVSGVAMITAITESPQPELTCQTFLDEINREVNSIIW